MDITELKVGDTVVAIGGRLRLQGSVSEGIISAMNRIARQLRGCDAS